MHNVHATTQNRDNCSIESEKIQKLKIGHVKKIRSKTVKWTEIRHVLTNQPRDQKPNHVTSNRSRDQIVTWSITGHMITNWSRDQKPVTWSKFSHMTNNSYWSRDKYSITWSIIGHVTVFCHVTKVSHVPNNQPRDKNRSRDQNLVTWSIIGQVIQI